MPDPTRKTVSSTELAGLFGLSPWVTPLALYQRFAEGLDIEQQENMRMRIGKLLQPAILQLASEELRLDVTHYDETKYLVDRDARIGCSLDGTVVCPTRGAGCVETKNVDWLRWRETYCFDEAGVCTAAPVYYELQLQAQMWVTGSTWGVIATLVGGNELVLLERVPDAELWERCKAKVAEFFQAVEERNAPDPMGAADYDLVRKLVPEYVDVPALDLRGDADGEELVALWDQYTIATELSAQNAVDAKGLKTQILAFIQDRGAHGVVLTDAGTLYVKVDRRGSTRIRFKETAR